MKYLLILILIFFQVFADEKKEKITIGAGPYIQTQPYENVDNLVLASPVIFYDNGILYVRWTRVGLYFLGNKEDNYAWGFSLTAQPRVYRYKSSDIEGMDERKSSWEGGLALSASAGKAYIEIIALTDILNKHESWIVTTEIGYDINLGKFSLYPSITAIYQSSEFLDYYYGVTNKEAITSNYSAYFPHAGVQLGIQTYIKYPITDNLSTLVNIRADKLANEAKNSPLVNDEYIYSGLLSLIYTFEY